MSIGGLAKVLAAMLGGYALLELGRTVLATLWLGGVLPELVEAAYLGVFLLGGVATLVVVPAFAALTWRAARNLATCEPDFPESVPQIRGAASGFTAARSV